MSSNHQQQHMPAGEAIGTILLVGLVTVLFLVWSTAELAMGLFRGHFFDATSALIAHAMIALPRHWSDPAAAWPAPYNSELPSAGRYWTAIVLEVLTLASIAIGGFITVSRIRLVSFRTTRSGLDRRERAGVLAQGRFARTSDLRPLFSRLPLHGRFLLGKVGRHLLATEPPLTTRGRGQMASSGAVAIVGPSRSGKTMLANEGIRNWDGPAILISLKTDMLEATYDSRAARGEVQVFDPAGVTTFKSARWTPLSSAATTDGAMRAARALVEAAPRDASGVSEGRFWNDMAESLLAGLMVLAANCGRTFADVVRWVVSVDTPTDGAPGEVAPLLRALRSDPDPQKKEAAAFATQVLEGLWRNDHRTVSSVYTTARTVVWPWVNPVVAETASETTVDAPRLLAEASTLYVSIPLADQMRLRPVLGGVLNDLVSQVFDRFVRMNAPLDPPLLIVIDEAATLRPDQLASWVATLAGAGVQLVTIWQSLSQIDAAYGAHGQAILTNHLTKVFLPGMSDLAGLDYLGRLAGDEHLPSYLGGQWGNHDEREPVATVPLTPPTVLRQMKRGRALLLHGTLPPASIRIQQSRR